MVWIFYNKTKSVKIKIRQTKVAIKDGDLFDESGKKVIAFNEYFDTIVEDIIAKGSLNGQYITDKKNLIIILEIICINTNGMS